MIFTVSIVTSCKKKGCSIKATLFDIKNIPIVDCKTHLSEQISQPFHTFHDLT